MAFVARVLAAGPQLWDGAVKLWDGAHVAAAHASAFWFAADKDCKHAIVVAASMCMGYAPERYTPGFGPFSLGFGWLFIGFILGWLVAIHVPTLAGWAEQARHMPPNMKLRTRRPAWHQAAEAALAQADGTRRLVLQRLVDDGDVALQLLTANAGVSSRIMLGRILGESVVQANAAQWNL